MIPRSLAATLLVLLAACGGQPESAAPGAPPALETLTVTASSEDGGLLWDGVVQAVEQSLLSAQTAGRVARVAADVDQRVARGAVLLQITAEEQSATVATATAQVRAAEAQLADAASRFERARSLIERRLISNDDFDRVRAAHEAQAAARDAAAAQLAQARQQLDYTVVRAPYAGIIAARHVEPGETVAPGQPLFTLYAPGQLRLEVQVPQSDAERIRDNPEATVVLPSGHHATPASVMVFPSADPLAHSTTVRVVLPALDKPPRPGQMAKVRFVAASGTAGVWLPTSAVVVRGELSGAYVVRDDGIVLRQLRIGRRDGERVEVLAGLTAGEQVAVNPVAALQALREGRTAAEILHD